MSEENRGFVVAGSRRIEDEDAARAVELAIQPALESMREDLSRTKSRRVRLMLGTMVKRMLEPGLTVAKIKEVNGLRDNSIAIRFHRECQRAPKEYLLTMILESGARLLRAEPDLRIWRIAEYLGFSSLGVFSKAFYRVFGVRPNTYRNCGDDSSKEFVWNFATLRTVLEGRAAPRVAKEVMAELAMRYPRVWAELADEEPEET